MQELDKSSRASGHLKKSERIRILDDSTRKRRLSKYHESLEAENIQEDPYVDFLSNRNLPEFDDALEIRTRKKKERASDYFQSKYGKSLQQLVEADVNEAENTHRPNYQEISAPKSECPGYDMCTVCSYNGNYNCIACGRRCQSKCFITHLETQCQRGV